MTRVLSGAALIALTVGVVWFASDDLFRTKTVKWTARFTVLNVTNKAAMYKFSSTRSGTHFVSPRTFRGEFGFRF